MALPVKLIMEDAMPVEGYPIYSRNYTKEYRDNYDNIRWEKHREGEMPYMEESNDGVQDDINGDRSDSTSKGS